MRFATSGWPEACTVLGRGVRGRGFFSRKHFASALIVLLPMVLPSLAVAQIAPSQVTPETLRPSTRAAGGGIALPATPELRAPIGAERLNVRVGRVAVEGGFPGLADATRALLPRVEGRRVSVADTYAFANAVEQVYAAAGYVLARVVLPPQHLRDGGAIRLLVIDGQIEAVDVSGVPERVRAVVAGRTASLVGVPRLTLAEIERRLLIAGDAPGVRLKSTLMRGQRDGGTRLVLEGTHRLLSGSIGADNRLDTTLGRWQLNGNLALNSPFGFGEQFYGAVGSGTDLGQAFGAEARLRLFGGGAVIPLGSDGWTINPEYTHSQTQPTPLPGAPATRGTFERLALRSSYPLIRTRTQALNVDVSLEAIRQRTEALGFGVDLSRDRYAVLRAGATYGTAFPWGMTTQANATYSQGLGGRDRADAVASLVPLSRLGGDPDFSKLSASVRVVQTLPWEMQFDLTARAQWAFNQPMLSSEQFSLDGLDQVSAFAAGTFNVDQGATLRGELGRSFGVSRDGWGATLTPYLFASGGRGEILMPTAVERAWISAAASGVGLRIAGDVADGAVKPIISAEVGRSFSTVAGEREGWRGNLAVSVRF